MERRRRRGGGGGGRGGEVTVVAATVVALATALLMVQGVVGEAATSNPLRTSHLTLDQYSPSPLYHHGLFGFYGRRSNNDGSSDGNDYQQQQQQQQQQLQQGLQQRQYLVNRKFEDDSIIYRSIDDRHNRRGSIGSISANDYPIRIKAYDKDNKGATISRDSPGMNVPQYDKERSKNVASRKEFDENKGNNDYVVLPSEMDEPFVADETFKDEGPGSVEIYKLDLFEEKKPQLGPMSNAKGIILGGVGGGRFLTGSLPASPASSLTSVTMKTSNNKSKVPKKSSPRHGWKHGKPSSNGSFKSTMITTTTSVSNRNDDDDDDGSSSSSSSSSSRSNKDGKDLHGRSNFLDSELRSEVPTSVEAFGVGGVPELQVGCEGLEADGASPFSPSSPSSFSSPSSSSSSSSFPSSPSSIKLKRSIENTKIGERKVDSPAPLNVVPISLNLDYDLSEESYEEMDELLKLKKFENEPKRNKENRGDIDPTLDDILIKDRNIEDKLPVRGDLGNWSEPLVESIKRYDNDLTKVKRERRNSEGSDRGTSEYVSSFKGHSRKLLWDDTNRESGLWGYGENEGVVSSDELDTELRRRQRVERRREDNVEARNIVHNQIDTIRDDYERSLEQERRRHEEILRRLQEQGTRRPTSTNLESSEERRKMMYHELKRKQEEAMRQEEENRKRNLMTPEDRRDYDNRRREQLQHRRLLEEDMERRRRLMEEERIRYEDMERRKMESSVPSNLVHPHNRTRNVNREDEERNLAIQRERYRDIERKRMEDERRRQMLNERRRRMEENRRRMEENNRRRKLEEERRRNMEMDTLRSRENVTRDDRNEEEYRRRMEERRRKLEEERRLQDYVRRNQPIEVRPDWQRRNDWNVSQRLNEVQEQRKAIEAVRQMNRSNRYPLGSGHERRQHGPLAPTYVDPRVSFDEARRRQEIEVLQERRRQQEEEQRRRIIEEERRREIDYRRAQSRKYEEERKRVEESRLKEERRRQQEIEDQRRQSEFLVSRRINPVHQQQRIREEQARNREIELRRQENRDKSIWEKEMHNRALAEQRRRNEEARLNALPVSASIIIHKEGTPSYPPTNSRSQFIFPDQPNRSVNAPNRRVNTSNFPKIGQTWPISTKALNGPSPCVWAVIQCCPTVMNRLVRCFESLGCPGVNWDPNPCSEEVADAARDEVLRYYNSAQQEQNH